MDHLGIDTFTLLGFFVGGPFIWNLLKRAPDRIAAAVLVQSQRFATRDAQYPLRQQYAK
ncbi:pimeloyl-ACP methyl ester carboxylesterase [Bradyrhizobium sp. USDA 4509]